jgi:lipoate-protein ligase A
METSMHGEYKIPGGKLVVVDIDIKDGVITRPQISGDFFLAPEEALDWMTAALDGVAANVSEEELGRRLRQALTGAELLGLTPEGVAVAVRRAIVGTNV